LEHEKIKIKAELKRHSRSGLDSIEVTFPDGNKDNLWYGLVELGLKRYSTNEIIKIVRDVQNQLNAMDPDDIPLIWREMVSELQQTMINRRIYHKESLRDKESEIQSE